MPQLITHGGQLLTHNGQLLYWQPATSGDTTGHGTLTATAQGHWRQALLGGHGALTASKYAKIPAPAAPHSHGVLSVSAYALFTSAATLAGSGVATATAHATKFALAATLSGHGALTATTLTGLQRNATLSGHGALTASAHAKFTVSATLSGHGALTSAEYAKFASAATLSGHGALTATATAKYTRAATLSGNGALTAAVYATVQYDTTGGGNTSSSTPATLSETHVISGNCVVVAVLTFTGQTGTCKVGATSMTSLGLVTDDLSASNGSLQMFYLLSPPTGSQTITVSWSTHPTYAAINSVSAYNVSSVGTFQSGSGQATILSQNVTSAAGDFIVQAFVGYRAFASESFSGYNQTSRYSSGNLGLGIAMIMGTSAGSSSANFAVTAAGTTDYSQGAVSLNHA